jgi:hypothetical protein
MTGLITLYARKEPTTDSTTLAHPEFTKGNEQDIVLYSNAEATEQKCRFPWYYSTKPDRRNKTVMFNCHRWRLEWLPALA